MWWSWARGKRSRKYSLKYSLRPLTVSFPSRKIGIYGIGELTKKKFRISKFLLGVFVVILRRYWGRTTLGDIESGGIQS
jgi:hypothetical protein